jgi:hypothetical protein
MLRTTDSSGDSEDTNGEQVPRLDADEFEEGTLYWLVAVEDADDDSPRYRPRRVESVEEDRVTFDAGYYDLQDDPDTATGRRFKVTDSGFSRRHVRDMWASEVLPGAVLSLTVEGTTREVRVLDALYGGEERYYVREVETDALYYLNRDSSTLRRAGDYDATHSVEEATGVENGTDPTPLDSPTSPDETTLQRLRSGGEVEVVYHNGHGFSIARDGEAFGVDHSPAVEVAEDALDGRRSARKSSYQISISWDPETDELLKVGVRGDAVKPSVDADEFEDDLRATLVEETRLRARRDPFADE